MKYLALCLLLAGCATPVERTHHTEPVKAPSFAPVTTEITKAKTSNSAAQTISDRFDGKTQLVLKWLKAHR